MNLPDGRSPRPPRRRLDGVVLVDKPVGLSSNAVLQRVKRAFRAEKAGHTGTLDPLASGLLPVCLGEATKFSAGLLDAGKEYRAVVHLGVRTETGDSEGAVIATGQAPDNVADVERVLDRFRGDIVQTPHRYSALKRDGRPLYSYARAGEEVAIAARNVRIDRLDVEGWDPPRLTINVACSKGTYIRSLAEDIGDAVGCGAHVSALRRTAVGDLNVEDAVTLDTIEAADEAGRDRWVRPASLLVATLPRIELQSDAAARFLHGQRIALDATASGRDALVGVYRCAAGRDEPVLLGTAELRADGGAAWLVPIRVVASAGAATGRRPEQDKSAFGLNSLDNSG